MFHLIYLSSATNLFSAEELKELLRVSRINNSLLDVTGMLLYRDGNFLQVLEGDEEETVRGLYAKILRDPRHKGTIVVLAEEIPQREFSEWSMGFRELNAQDEPGIEGYSDFLNGDWTVSQMPNELLSKCRRLLNMFRRNVR